jgi:hypothetical protein
VDEEQNGFHVPVGKPGLVKNIGVPHAFEIAFDVVHGVSLDGG